MSHRALKLEHLEKMIRKARDGLTMNFAFGLGADPDHHVLAVDPELDGKKLLNLIKGEHKEIAKGTWGRFQVRQTAMLLSPEKQLAGLKKEVRAYAKAAGLKVKDCKIEGELDEDGGPPDLQASASSDADFEALDQEFSELYQQGDALWKGLSGRQEETERKEYRNLINGVIRRMQKAVEGKDADEAHRCITDMRQILMDLQKLDKTLGSGKAPDGVAPKTDEPPSETETTPSTSPDEADFKALNQEFEGLFQSASGLWSKLDRTMDRDLRREYKDAMNSIIGRVNRAMDDDDDREMRRCITDVRDLIKDLKEVDARHQGPATAEDYKRRFQAAKLDFAAAGRLDHDLIESGLKTIQARVKDQDYDGAIDAVVELHRKARERIAVEQGEPDRPASARDDSDFDALSREFEDLFQRTQQLWESDKLKEVLAPDRRRAYRDLANSIVGRVNKATDRKDEKELHRCITELRDLRIELKEEIQAAAR